MWLSLQVPIMSKNNKETKNQKPTTDTSQEKKVASVDPKKETTEVKSKEAKPPQESSDSQTDVTQTKSTQKDQTKVEPTLSKTPDKSSQSDTQKEKSKTLSQSDNILKLHTLFAFKMGMTNVYDQKNNFIPVTVLKYEPCTVTQIKTKEKEGYEAVQIALPSSKSVSRSQKNHLKKANFQKGATFIREVRGTLPKDVKVGHKVSIESFQEGDRVSISGTSKGHGFCGVVKRWGFGGGPASHGAEKHRTTGSIANTATQGKVFPGKKMPGRYGGDQITIRNVQVARVIPDKGVILVKGSVPGSFRSLIKVSHKRNQTEIQK